MNSAPRPPWRLALALFVATVASVFASGVAMQDPAAMSSTERLVRGAQFAGALLSILVAHESGHFIAARLHKVEASFPHFLPMPWLSPFGTMGAVIRMRGEIRSRAALLDIGAAGPLAGLIVAIPLYVWGVAHSRWVPVSSVDSEGFIQLGDSLLLKALDRLAAPSLPDTQGMDLELSPVAFGAWGGLFVTMINLLPIGQLDGGHVAYALLGERQNTVARTLHRCMLLVFLVLSLGPTVRDLRADLGFTYAGVHAADAMFWLVWFQVLAVLGSLTSSRASDATEHAADGYEGDIPHGRRMSTSTRIVATLGLLTVGSLAREHHNARLVAAFWLGFLLMCAMEALGGALGPHRLVDHPRTERAALGPIRASVAVLTLAMFVLLFMPRPFRM